MSASPSWQRFRLPLSCFLFAHLTARWFSPLIATALPGQDFKTSLQEFTHARYKAPPSYHLMAESGPGHARHFQVEVRLQDQPLAQGEGRTKKEAEQAAAESQSIADVIAAKQAAEANKAALDARLQASDELASTQQAAGVKFAWDFEVHDIDLLATRQRACVEITPRRREIKQMLDLWAERLTDDKLVDTFEDLGIRLFKKPVISTR